jgi:tRNA threonylcarbamoyladenosine biosynthesis protein TsaB
VCNPEREMQGTQSVAEIRSETGLLVLGVDTCGPSGTVALARLEGGAARILGKTELAGRSYSATLVAAVGDLLAGYGVKLGEIGSIVVVSGPGSFTGVRVGLSAVKGLAEPRQIPVVAVSRLAVLAAKVGVGSAALDAHRHEVFLRLAGADGCTGELLAGAEELAHAHPPPAKIAVCDEQAAELLKASWQGVELIRSDAPTAADAIQLCVARILAREFDDLTLLDGHYLRRSDAEIFGDPTTPKAQRA